MEPIPERVDRTARAVVDGAFRVQSALGPGLLESVYHTCLLHELRKQEIPVLKEVSVPILYDGIRIDAGFRLDLLVDAAVVVELKAVDVVLPVHRAQIITYLKLTGLRLGLLINFNVPVIKNGIMRIAV